MNEVQLLELANSQLPTSLKDIVRDIQSTYVRPQSSYGDLDYTLSYGPEDRQPASCFNQACFGALAINASDTKTPFSDKPYWLTYLPLKGLSSEQASHYLPWVLLLQSVNVLPSHQPPREIVSKGLSVCLSDPQLSPYGLYLQLSLLRHLKDSPQLVRYCLQMSAAGADFWAAFFYLHDLYSTRNDHSLIPAAIYGGQTVGNIAPIVSMHRFQIKNGSIDPRNFFDVLTSAAKSRDSIPWNIHKQTNNLSLGISCVAKPKWRLLDSRLLPIFQARDSEEARELISHLYEEGILVDEGQPTRY